MLIALLFACLSEPPAPVAEPPPSGPTLEEYRASVAAIEAKRGALDRRREQGEPPKVLYAEARALLMAAFRQEVYPAWQGTPWHFYGTSEVPQKGTIACGHLLGVWLRALQFDVDRLALGAQASEHIVKTFVPESEIWRFREKTTVEVVDAVAARGDGLYLLGLDFHAAMLDVEGDEVRICHASNFSPIAVICEDARTAPAMESHYRVVGRLLNDRAIRRWVEGGRFQVVTP